MTQMRVCQNYLVPFHPNFLSTVYHPVGSTLCTLIQLEKKKKDEHEDFQKSRFSSFRKGGLGGPLVASDPKRMVINRKASA